MTQEDKELLLKYLCMALPYGVKVHCGEDLAMTLRQIDYQCFCESWENEDIKSHSRWKLPYLRPMSSMTQEEKTQMAHDCYVISLDFEYKTTDMVALWNTPRVINWLLEHHFDFLGLISKGLAIEVTESNNPYK